MQNGRPDFPDAIEAAGDCPKGGRHEPFDTPPDPDGRPVDTELLGAFMGAAGVDGQNPAMYALAHAMSRAELRVAVSNAADLIVGMLALFGVVGDGT